MAPYHHRRHIGLFLVAVVFPFAVLVALGIRTIGQERELATNRLTDDRRRAVGDVRDALVATLERLVARARDAAENVDSRQSRSYEDPAIALVARIVGGEMVLPWEDDAALAKARASLAEVDFSRLVTRGERAEFSDRDFASATAAYRQAFRRSGNETQRAYARLLLGRVATAASNTAAARDQFVPLLDAPSEAIDEYGVPLALYAAAGLLDAHSDVGAVLLRLREEIEEAVWRAPTTQYMLRDLVTRVATSANSAARQQEAAQLLASIDEQIRVTELALTLQQDLPLLRPRSQEDGSDGAPPPWLSYGDGTWLAASPNALDSGADVVVAVKTQDVIQRVQVGDVAARLAGPFGFVAGRRGVGEPLGPPLRDLEIAFAEPLDRAVAQQVGIRNSFYLAALAFVLSITLFGGYFLFRDVRRELRVAQLRSDFVSSVSHELKTPLTAIRMFAETLRLRDEFDPVTRAEYLDTIVSESERLTRLLNNVLDLSKIEQGQKLYRREPTSLADVADRAARALEHPLARDDFRLHVEIDDGLATASVDGDAMEQAILNLITNSMKYSGESRDINLKLRAQNGHAIIEVADRGIGIPADVQSRLTEKFFRVRSPENEQIPGTGLGLTIVEHTARAHGGYLTIASTIGEGSTFAIHLPLEPVS